MSQSTRRIGLFDSLPSSLEKTAPAEQTATWTPRYTTRRDDLNHGLQETRARRDLGHLTGRVTPRKVEGDGMLLGYHRDGNPKHFISMHRRHLGSTRRATMQGEDFGGVTFGHRSLERKGRGTPPPDGLELQPVTRRNLLAETSSPSRDILGQRGFQGVEERREPPGKRVDFPRGANKASLIGGAAMVDDCKQEASRRHWKPVAGSSLLSGDTFDRTMVWRGAEGLVAEQTGRIGHGARLSSRTVQDMEGRGDLLTYRSSSGRATPYPAAPAWIGAPPQSATKNAAALREAFDQAQLGYTLNKTQAAGTFSFTPPPLVATVVH